MMACACAAGGGAEHAQMIPRIATTASRRLRPLRRAAIVRTASGTHDTSINAVSPGRESRSVEPSGSARWDAGRPWDRLGGLRWRGPPRVGAKPAGGDRRAAGLGDVADRGEDDRGLRDAVDRDRG